MTATLFRQTATSALIATVLGGCSLAPTYERPAAPMSAAWPDQPKLHYGAYNEPTSLGSQPGDAVTPAAPPAIPGADLGWREFLRDARLQKLIELSLVNNRDLRVAMQRVEQARAQYGIQRGEQYPSIGAGIQGTRERLPPNMRQGGSASPSTAASYQAGIGLTTFEIDLFGRLKSLSEAALQQYFATEQARKSVQLTVVSSVAQSYFNLRAAEVELDLTKQTLASRQQSYSLVKSRFDGGVASELDLNQSKSLLDSASADLASLARARSQAINALVLVIGMPLPDDLPPPAVFGRDQLLAAVPAGLPSQLLERRPDILAAENQLQSANANIGAARAAFFPTISLTGLLGTLSPSLGTLFKGGQGYWSFSPSITTPIFAGGSIRSGLDLARASERLAVAQYEQSIQQAFREVSDALAGEATYGAQLDALRALAASSSRTLELSNLRYQGGVDSYLQVQTAQVNDFSAQLGLVQAGQAALNNRVELYKALGGGWAETTPENIPTATGETTLEKAAGTTPQAAAATR
jgi:multidrug efflux system outer membrane protein